MASSTIQSRSFVIDLALGFIAGALAVAVFLQLMVFILTQAGMIQGAVYSMRPIPPLGIPAILNQMFWGGVWGLVFVLIIDRIPQARPIWLVGLLLGAIALPMVGWFVVAPIKGNPVAAGWNTTRMLASVLINAGWGIGLVLIYILLQRLAGGSQARTA